MNSMKIDDHNNIHAEPAIKLKACTSGETTCDHGLSKSRKVREISDDEKEKKMQATQANKLGAIGLWLSSTTTKKYKLPVYQQQTTEEQ